MQVKQMNLDIYGTITRITQGSLKEENTVCKSTCMSILIYQVLIGKTDPADPTKQEDYLIHILETKAPLGLNIEDGL